MLNVHQAGAGASMAAAEALHSASVFHCEHPLPLGARRHLSKGTGSHSLTVQRHVHTQSPQILPGRRTTAFLRSAENFAASKLEHLGLYRV